MVRKNAAAEARHVASSLGGSGSNSTAPSSYKRSKKRKSSSSTSFNLAGCLLLAGGVLLTVLGVGYVALQSYSPPVVEHYAPNKLRKKSQVRNLQQTGADGEDDAATPQVVADTFLPPNSLYQVSMPNIRGEMIGFDRFRGFVTLVVNVACL